MNIFARLLFYVFTVLLAFFSGPFFLLPWYSVSGPYRQYKDYGSMYGDSLTNLIQICKGSPLPPSTNMLFLSVTTLPNLHDKNISIVTLLWTHGESDNVTSCPQGFEYVPNHPSLQRVDSDDNNHWANDLDMNATLFRQENALHCLQWRLETAYYIPFTPSAWEQESDYYGPRESSQHVAQMSFNLKSVPQFFPVYMQSVMLDFGVPVNVDVAPVKGYPIVRSESCRQNETNTVCYNFFDAMMNETKVRHPNDESNTYIDLYYKEQRGFCIANYQCAGVVRLSDEKCHGYFNPNKHKPECQFMLHYMVFPAIPKFYSFAHIWTYNVIAFVTCLMGWLFTAYYITMALHHSYLLYYYIKPPITRLEANTLYDVQLTIYGEPFSEFSGEFEIREQSSEEEPESQDKIVLRAPLFLEFDSEEYEGSYQAVITKDFTFKVEEPCTREITFACQWEGEFQQADFDAPNIQVIMRKHFPPMIASWSNAFGIAPFLCLFQLLTNYPDRKLFVRFEVFVFLSVFVSCVSTTWLLVILFTILMNIESLESVVYSTVAHRTKLPLAFYCLFIISVLAPAIITIIKPRRFASKFFAIDSVRTVRDSKAFMISQYHSSVAASRPRISHMNVDYVPLDNVSRLITTPTTTTATTTTMDIDTAALEGKSTTVPATPRILKERNNLLATPSMFFDDEDE